MCSFLLLVLTSNETLERRLQRTDDSRWELLCSVPHVPRSQATDRFVAFLECLRASFVDEDEDTGDFVSITHPITRDQILRRVAALVAYNESTLQTNLLTNYLDSLEILSRRIRWRVFHMVTFSSRVITPTKVASRFTSLFQLTSQHCC